MTEKNLIYSTEHARTMAFDCGYHFILSGSELTEAQQREVAEDIAAGCCGSRETKEEFVAHFLIGYAERTTNPTPIVERRGMYQVTIYTTHEDWRFVYRDGTLGVSHRVDNDNPSFHPVCKLCGRKWAQTEPDLLYDGSFGEGRPMTCPMCQGKKARATEQGDQHE